MELDLLESSMQQPVVFVMAEESRKEVTGPQAQKAVPARALSPFEEMDRLFENFSRRGWMRPFHWEWPSLGGVAAPFEGKLPRVDIIDREAEIVCGPRCRARKGKTSMCR